MREWQANPTSDGTDITWCGCLSKTRDLRRDATSFGSCVSGTVELVEGHAPDHACLVGYSECREHA